MTDAPPAPPRSGTLRTLALLALVVGCVACDQATKRVASARLAPGQRLSFLGDTFRLELAHNPGAFLGLGAVLPEGVRRNLFSYGVGLVSVGALAVALRPSSRRRVAIAAALVAAGGFGNLWDRIATGGWVVDFMNAGLGPLRTGIFNVADVVLMAGVFMLLLAPKGERTGGGAPAGAHGPPAAG